MVIATHVILAFCSGIVLNDSQVTSFYLLVQDHHLQRARTRHVLLKLVSVICELQGGGDMGFSVRRLPTRSLGLTLALLAF